MRDLSFQVSDTLLFSSQQLVLYVSVSPDHPAMKAVASGHDGSLQGRPENLKDKS